PISMTMPIDMSTVPASVIFVVQHLAQNYFDLAFDFVRIVLLGPAVATIEQHASRGKTAAGIEIIDHDARDLLDRLMRVRATQTIEFRWLCSFSVRHFARVDPPPLRLQSQLDLQGTQHVAAIR